MERDTNISEAFGMLERKGRPQATIQEMSEAVISKAVEDQERFNAAGKSCRTTLVRSKWLTRRL